MSAVATSAFEVLTDVRANLGLDGRAALANRLQRALRTRSDGHCRQALGDTPGQCGREAGVKRSRTQAMEGHVMVVREQRFEPATLSKRVQRGNDERP